MSNENCVTDVRPTRLSRRGFINMGFVLAGASAALPVAALADGVGGIAGLIGAERQAEEAVAEDTPTEVSEAAITEKMFDELEAVDPTQRNTVVEIVDDSSLATSDTLTVKVNNSNSRDTFASFVITVRVADADRFVIGDYECDFIERGSEFLFRGQTEERAIQIPWGEDAATYEIMSVTAELPDYGKLPFEIVEFGSYPQGENGEASPIQWYVIDTREDGSRLLLSKYVLDTHVYYDDSSVHFSWEDSAMRAWLNGEFIQTAFTVDEIARIAESKNAPSINVRCGTDSGYGTIDQVFLLGLDELAGIFSIPDAIFEDTASYMDGYGILVSALVTPYAVAQGVDTFSRSDMDYGDWAFRTPGGSAESIVEVDSLGSILLTGTQCIKGTLLGVRPALVLLP